MLYALLWVALINVLPLLIAIAKPMGIQSTNSFRAKSERAWLWGWAWGTESTVSVVDRSPILSFPSRPAAFGAEINDPVLGYVIPLSSFTKPCTSNDMQVPDNSGCPSLCLSGPRHPTEAWIALVQRGKCEFVRKVREAQRLGARAVVVGGEDPEVTGNPDTLVNMYSPEDASDIKIASTYIKYSDYMQLYGLILASNTTHGGLSTLSLLITAEYSAWEWYSPIITFIVILLLPSALTFITLVIHRIRSARAAQRDRAPEDIVRNLPWRIWTGTGWEKHEAGEDADAFPDRVSSVDVDLERGVIYEELPQANDSSNSPEEDLNASTSNAEPLPDQPWFESQVECAICLSEFVKGDKVRVLPCHHIFHLHEVDEWLIHRKKLCPVCKADVTQPPPELVHPHPPVEHIAHDNDSTPVTERTPLLRTGSGEHS